MKKENESLSDKSELKCWPNGDSDSYYWGKDIKEFINIHIEDLDWLWEIHPKIYNRIVAKFKERAGENLI